MRMPPGGFLAFIDYDPDVTDPSDYPSATNRASPRIQNGLIDPRPVAQSPMDKFRGTSFGRFVEPNGATGSRPRTRIDLGSACSVQERRYRPTSAACIN